MSCEELKDLYELYTLDVLEDDERDEIDAHLDRGCEVCTKGVHAALALDTALMSVVPDVAPPARLKRRLMAAIGAPEFERRSAWMSAWMWPALLAAAAMLALVVVSLQQRHTSAELADARQTIQQVSAARDRLGTERAEMMQALSFLNQPETQQVGFGKDKPARGNIFMNPKRGVLLIASNLPPLTPGRLFEMWVIPKGGAPRPAGMFRSSDFGTAFHMLAGPLDMSSGDAIAVTIEPEAGSAAPTTTPLFVAAF
jgi:anti-sigma-K factor RskA